MTSGPCLERISPSVLVGSVLFKARSTAQSICMSGSGHNTHKWMFMNVTVVLWIVDDCQRKDCVQVGNTIRVTCSLSIGGHTHRGMYTREMFPSESSCQDSAWWLDSLWSFRIHRTIVSLFALLYSFWPPEKLRTTWRTNQNYQQEAVTEHCEDVGKKIAAATVLHAATFILFKCANVRQSKCCCTTSWQGITQQCSPGGGNTLGITLDIKQYRNYS